MNKIRSARRPAKTPANGDRAPAWWLTHERVNEPVARLSGGERARLMLAQLVADGVREVEGAEPVVRTVPELIPAAVIQSRPEMAAAR